MSFQYRIVHAVSSGAFAGVERHVARLARAQSDAGHRVAVVGGDLAAMGAAIARKSVIQRSGGNVADTARAIDALAHCDVLHVHMTAAEVAATVAPRAAHLPVVSTRHFASRRGASLPGRLAAPLVARRVAAQISVSQYVARRIEGPSTVILPGVSSRPDALGPANRSPVVLVAQRLEPEKRTDLAVHAFAFSGLAQRGWRMEIAGDGSERRSLEMLVDRLGLTHAIRFLGHITDISTRMEEASILIAPCPIDALGLTVLEAMAAGLPVVAADAGGHRETVGTVEGAALYPKDEPEEAGLLIAALAFDTERRLAYGVRLQTTQRNNFTLDAQRRATDAVYRSIL